jgi:hypothetical protein
VVQIQNEENDKPEKMVLNHKSAAQHSVQRAPDPRESTKTMVVGLLLRSVRVFRQFACLEVGSVKVTLSHPAHQRVTPAVSPPLEKAR